MNLLDLSAVVRDSAVERRKVIDMFMKVRGIGEKLANILYDEGVRTVEEIVDAPGVPPNVRLAAKHFNDLHTMIPREELKKLIVHIRTALKGKVDHFNIIGCGSYRRGAPLSSDLDLLIITDEYNAKDIEEILKKDKLYVDTLKGGKDKVELLMRMNSDIPVRLVEIYMAKEIERGAAMIYLTGPAEFSIIMRVRAKRKYGMLLNQRGLYKDETLVASKTEKEIFTALDLPYIPPERRGSNEVYDTYFKE